jgi:protease II
VEHVIHGDRRVDHYAWLRKKENPEVIAYLEAENAYTDAVLKPTEAFQERLYQEMLGRILQTDLSVPYRPAAISISRAPKKESSMRFIAGAATPKALRRSCSST